MKAFIPYKAAQWFASRNAYLENFHLALNRYLFFDERDNKFAKLEPGKGLEKFTFPNVPFTALAEKTKYNAEVVHGDTLVKTLQYRTTERLKVGAASVLENSLRLHHIWGFPYLPASAIKGITRSYVIEDLFETEKKALEDKGFCLLFGCPKESALGEEHKGLIAFYDAIPVEAPTLKVDIMNPHYQEYFSGKKPPADYLSPIPIFFLTLDKGNTFQVCIGATSSEPLPAESKISQKDSLKAAEGFLGEALKENGIGAKTSIGYGIMKKTTP